MAPPLKLAALTYLCSGVVLNIVSQLITDTRFSAPQAHVIPWVKFTATLAGAALRRPRAATATTEQLWLMRLIGLLDASAYTVYCLGFAAVGATLANLVLAGVGQVLTAAFTRFLLRKHLTNGQLAGIGCVFLGLAVRAAPAAYFNGSPAGGAGDAKAAAAGGLALALRREQAVGAAWVALAALLYSLLGVAYERLLKGGAPPPTNAEIQWNTSILGFLAASAYQALYTLPNWDRMVGRHLAAAAAAGAGPRYVGALLALFGGLFNFHTFAQAQVFKAEGAIGVGLVNACRGAAITVVVSLLFCDAAARANLCLTRQTALSALITTIGGLVYVMANGMRRPPPPAAAPAAAPAPAAGKPPRRAAAAGKQAQRETAAAAAEEEERPMRVTRRRAAAAAAAGKDKGA